MSDRDTTEARTAWQLARLAECADPDSPDSPGASFLESVESSTIEAIDYNDGEWDDDMAHEIADGAVPVYTHSRWLAFVDLAAYNEDASELGADTSDMTQAAGVCLYMIAERLARAIAEEHEGNLDEDDA